MSSRKYEEEILRLKEIIEEKDFIIEQMMHENECVTQQLE